MSINEFIIKLADAIDIEDVDALTAETEFKNLEEWGSLSIMLLIAMMDEEFDRQIGDQEIRCCTTIEDLYKIAIS